MFGQKLIGQRMVGLVQSLLQFLHVFLLVLVLEVIKVYNLDWVEVQVVLVLKLDLEEI